MARKKTKNNSYKILIVEDDAYITGMYKTKLIMAGYDVKVAEDGEKGLAALEAETPDLLLLDIVLPKVDGFQILEEVRKNPKTKDLPVILLTNLGQKVDVERGLALGADDYMIKAHYTPSEVVEKISNLISRKKKK